MAAVLASGPGALLSHSSAAELWGIQPASRRRPEVSVSRARDPRPRGVRVHRRSGLGGRDVAERGGIPVTSPLRTLIDLASFLPVPRLEAAVNAADRLDLVHPPELRLALTRRAAMPGIARLRKLLDRDTFVLTDSDLERRFLAIVRRTGLPRPETGRRIGGFKVDFHWPRLGLVVETDGLRYHRTAAQQARDRRRDQAHAGMGLTTLRFTHDQVAHEPREVQTLLERVAARLATRAA